VNEVCLQIAGEEVALLPERALFWSRTRTVVAADLHWGKSATFRAMGIPVPEGSTRDDLTRLDSALVRTGAERLIVLGDLFHARAGRIATRTLAELREWRRGCNVEILLVRGNHDRHAGDPPDDLRINCVNAPAFVPPFVLRHEPASSPEGYTLAGHLHPGLALAGRALQVERLPCFLFGQQVAILPAFGSFTGLAVLAPGPADRTFVIAGDEVLPVR
jgi:DNA ligase-associated metallophosphoesterase